MNEKLIVAGGIYNILLILFHVSFWKIFNWPESINSLSRVNKSTIQVLNISITFIFFVFSYISLVHTDELLSTELGHSILLLISLLWLFRAVLQLIFYKLKHSASLGLFIFFVCGFLIYAIPVIR